LPESQFIDACTACQNCVSACPEGIIIRGSGGLPEIDFSAGECTFCNACIERCDEPALDRTISPPWSLDLKLSADCLALNRIVCQTCADMCDQGAIEFELRKGAVAAPRVSQDACNGCGACISACPSQSLSLLASQTPSQATKDSNHG
jgi:ferredoxin-type protein NapF